MDPYAPPTPGYLVPPPANNQGQRGQTWYVVWLVLSCLTLCGCGLMAVIPVGLSIGALVTYKSPTNSAQLLNRAAIVCVVLNWLMLLATMLVQVAIAVMEAS